jgi:hypothetical protein
MVPLLADENFFGPIYRALLQRRPDVNIVRVQDVGLMGSKDQRILEWAAQRDRVLLTHDRETIPQFAYERIREERDMAGVMIVDDELAPGNLASSILHLMNENDADRFADRVFFLSA